MTVPRKNPYNLQAACTVEELIRELQKLPPSMEVNHYGEGVLPVVFNRGLPDEHLSLEENDGTWDD